MPTKDPRTYIKTLPLPIPSQKGLKLQARAATVYNPTSPTRQEVWKQNFDRRREQRTEQGFYSVQHKPYKGVGDPFYLDEKKLILHSLGQWDESDTWDTSSSSDEEEDGAGALTLAPQSTMTAAKFVLRRARKDLNTLGKEVVKGRGMIRNVKLGHSLFDLIRQERLTKKAAAFAEKKKHLEASRNQWQPPHNSSSEEESDDDLDRDDDLENYFGPNVQDGCSEDVDMVSSGSQRYSMDVQSRLSKPNSASSGRKKKKVVEPRPFTPQHTNLSEVTEYNENFSECALFRQLCALNWILDAMNVEQGYTMGPITTCWSHLEVGGSKITSKRAREERKAETDWEKWLNNQQMGRVSKKGSITRLSRQMRQPRFLTHPRVSVQSTSLSPSSSSSQVNTTGHCFPPMPKDSIAEDQMMGTVTQEPEEDVTLLRTGIFKFLDEYYDSLRREAQVEEEKQKAATGGGGEEAQSQMLVEQSDNLVPSQQRESRSHKKSKKSDHQKTPEGQLGSNPRFDSPEERNRSKFFLKDLRMDSSYKPKNTAELLEFHATKSSNRYGSLRQDLHNRFKEVQDDKAMTLHDILEQMDRERLSKCQSKLSKLRTQSMSFHRAVEEMRREGEKLISRPDDVRRQSSFKGNWYTDLLQSLPCDIKDIWYYRTVLQRLAKYGLVENTSKQSVYKFLKVLESLRHWEICSPDISAAIEFCREKIVDMTVDEYEEWFTQAFPKVSRPRTAPVGRKGQQTELMKQGQGQKGMPEVGSSKTAAMQQDFDRIRSRDGGTHSSYGTRQRGRSAVSISNGADGRRRLVQSAVARKV